jgi:hypothetical protein
MDRTDGRIADAMTNLTVPVGADAVVANVMARTGKRGAGRGVLLLIPVVAFAIGVLAMGRGPAPLGSTSNTGALAPNAAASPGAASLINADELTPCGRGLAEADVESVVHLAAASDFGTAFPAYKGQVPEEANNAAPAYVVVLKDRYPVVALRLNRPPAGQTWPPYPTLEPGHRDVCFVIPSAGDGTGGVGRPLVLIYGDIDIAGFQP